MALPPKFSGHRLPLAMASNGTQQTACHTVELFLDFVCPFSAKMFKTLSGLRSALGRESQLASRIQIIFRHQVQPWHPTSTLTHEAAVAVLKLAPSRFWDFSEALFNEQKDFFDISSAKETRNQTYRRLAQLAAQSTSVDEEEVYALLAIADKPGPDGALNTGNGTTEDLKVLVKMARLVGVHVSPTVLFDGVVASEISSSWTVEEWMSWLSKKTAAE